MGTCSWKLSGRARGCAGIRVQLPAGLWNIPQQLSSKSVINSQLFWFYEIVKNWSPRQAVVYSFKPCIRNSTLFFSFPGMLHPCSLIQRDSCVNLWMIVCGFLAAPEILLKLFILTVDIPSLRHNKIFFDLPIYMFNYYWSFVAILMARK